MTPAFIWPAYFFAVGAAIGSFLNVVIYRLPRGESVVRPGSHCYACNQPIRWYHNMPIISYFLLRGKCASCGAPFSPRYMFVELLTGILFAACLIRFGLNAPAFVYMLLCAALVAVFFIDLDHFLIPDVITLPGIAVGFGCALFVLPLSMTDAALGFVAGFGIFFLLAVAVPGGMGGGDIKLMGMLGLFLGLKAVLITIFLGSFIGAAIGLIGKLFFGKGSKIPFGPYLVAGALAALFFEREIIDTYLRLVLPK